MKLGDGAADVKPIAHLYKTQVYQLAAYLGVPEKIRCRPPSFTFRSPTIKWTSACMEKTMVCRLKWLPMC